MSKKIIISISFLILALGAYAQIGIRAGVNIANQSLYSDISDFSKSDLTAFQIGAVYQYMPQKMGFGLESGLLFSQKGSSFNYNDETKKGYNELNYLEIPLNLRYKITFGPIGLYAYAGLYGSYLVRAKTVFDDDSNSDPKLELGEFKDRIDYGYSVGAGIELLRKVQVGANWNSGFKDISSVYAPTPMKITSGKNRVFSVNVTLLF